MQAITGNQGSPNVDAPMTQVPAAVAVPGIGVVPGSAPVVAITVGTPENIDNSDNER